MAYAGGGVTNAPAGGHQGGAGSGAHTQNRIGGSGYGGHGKPITPARTDVHLHITPDGQVQVRKITSSDPNSVVSVHRGMLPA